MAAALDGLSDLQLQAPVVELEGLDTFRDQVQLNNTSCFGLALQECSAPRKLLALLEVGTSVDATLFPILQPWQSQHAV